MVPILSFKIHQIPTYLVMSACSMRSFHFSTAFPQLICKMQVYGRTIKVQWLVTASKAYVHHLIAFSYSLLGWVALLHISSILLKSTTSHTSIHTYERTNAHMSIQNIFQMGSRNLPK